jgi:hypothetical protein
MNHGTRAFMPESQHQRQQHTRIENISKASPTLAAAAAAAASAAAEDAAAEAVTIMRRNKHLPSYQH